MDEGVIEVIALSRTRKSSWRIIDEHYSCFKAGSEITGKEVQF